MNEGDGGLARHSTECPHGIDWEHSRIVGKERNNAKRKMLEGVETIKQKLKGRTPLNSYNQMEQWQSTISSFLATSLINCVSHLHGNGVGFMQFCENIC